MSRNGWFVVALVLSVLFLGLALIFETPVMLGLWALVAGVTAFAFASEFGERRTPGAYQSIPEPSSPGGRRVMYRIIGGGLALAGVGLLIAQLV